MSESRPQQHPLFDIANSGGLCTAKQLAERLQISVAYIYKLMKDDGLPYLKLGRCTRYDSVEVSVWLSQRRRP